MMKKTVLVLSSLLWAGISFGQMGAKGKVIDENGNPLVGVLIRLVESSTITDEDGAFQIESSEITAPGRYGVSVSYLGHGWSFEPFEFSSDEKYANMEIVLKRKPIELESVVVKATRAGEKTPFTYSSISKYEIKKRNLGQDIPYILEGTPSVVVTSDAGAGIGYTGMRIRGTDPTRTNVTINGIPLNDAESQGVFWVNMPDFATSTNDIQVQRGVGTSTNGAGAFGASVNLNTSKLNQIPYAEIRGTVGSFNTWKTTASFGTGLINKQERENKDTQQLDLLLMAD